MDKQKSVKIEIIKADNPDQKSETCEKILRSLPSWFGIESAIVNYIKDVRDLDFLAATDGREVVGFCAVKVHYSINGEIFVMGVLPAHQGRGVGTRLIKAAEGFLREQGVKYMSVKTLSESSDNREYEMTRKFYLSAGFEPFEELKELWDEWNPCLLLVKKL